MRTRPVPLAIRIPLAVLSIGLGVWLARPLLAQKAGQSPGEFYLSYVAAAETMKSVRDIAPYLPADQAAMMNRMPKEFEKEMLQEAKKELVTGVKVLKESPYQDGYLLELEGTRKATSQKVKGWAKITKERGAWKLAKDDWSGVPPPAPPKIPARVPDAGKAVGEFTVNGQTAKLLYARAIEEPDSFDKRRPPFPVSSRCAPTTPPENDSNATKASRNWSSRRESPQRRSPSGDPSQACASTPSRAGRMSSFRSTCPPRRSGRPDARDSGRDRCSSDPAVC